MKVLLRRNVSKLGIIGDVVDVKPGYARNYLVPMGLATEPTPGNLKAIEEEKQAYLERVAKEKAELEAKAKAIDGKEVTIASRANEEGQLYGSVGPAQIAAALAEENILVDAKYIVLDEAIRNLDKYDVTVRFGEEVTATIHVWVVPIREEGAETGAKGSETQTPTAEEQASEASEQE